VIIIETTTRERLVLVPEKQIVCTTHTRDATPEDLARGGFVLREQAAPGTLAHLRADLRDMTARAEKAEAHIKGLHDAEQETRRILDAVLGERTSDAATRLHNDWVDTRERAEKAEREREECESVLTAMGARAREAEEFARVLEVERDTARAELARLRPDGVDEPLDVELGGVFAQAKRDSETGPHVVSPLRVVYRLGVAHERARHGAQDRATDEELVAIARAAYDATDEAGIPWIDRIASRVAARVRQERCLVAQAVGMGATVTVERTSARVPGTTGMWDVRVSRRPDAPGEHYAYGVPAAEVPATLARLLGEVARG
jgi:hypothetical protein